MDFKARFLARIGRQPVQPESSLVYVEHQLFQQYYNKLKAHRSATIQQPIPQQTAPSVADKSRPCSTIPPFYQRLPSAADSLGQKLREEARTLFLQKRSRELLDNNELKALWALLDGAHQQPTPKPTPPGVAVVADASATATLTMATPLVAALHNADKYIGYDAYLTVQRAAGLKCRRYLTSAIFARLQSVSGQPAGRVSILALFNYVMRKVWLQQTRIGLSLYDYTGLPICRV